MSNIVLSTTRPQELLKIMEQIRDVTKKNFFVMADLLLEAYDGKYYEAWGYTNFKEWIENCDLDMSSRNAYYLVTVAKRTQELGLSQEELQKLPISSLKKIFSLDPAKYEDEIKGLLSSAGDMTVGEVEKAVDAIKAVAGEETYTYLNLKLPSSVKDVADAAFELVRMLNGNTTLEDGSVVEISDSKCLEYILVSFMNDPNNHGEQHAEEEQEPIPVSTD